MIGAAKKLYSRLHSRLPLPAKGMISRALVDLRLKPTVNKGKRGFFKKGVVVFSADFELAWAYRWSRTVSDPEEPARRERQQVPQLLKLFAENDIPVTWATVGHLFLSLCQKNDAGLAHPDMPRPSHFSNEHWKFDSGDWYRRDPGTDLKNDPCWYAPDLVKLIRKSHVRNEIACHTFSHIDFTYKNCPKELAVAEIQMCQRLAAESCIRLESMAFPGGTAGNYEALKKSGFICYRKKTPYDIDVPEIDNLGLVAIPSGQQLEKDAYGWSAEFHIKKFACILERADRYGEMCHFWFHPSMDSGYLKNVLPRLLPLVAEARTQGRLEVLTMAELARRRLTDELHS